MNQTGNGKFKTVRQFWENIVNESLTQKIFISGTKKYSYSDLKEDIQKSSTFFKEKSVHSGDTILLITSHEYHCPQLFLSAFFNGICTVILDTEIKLEFLQTVIQQTNPKLIICDPDKLTDTASIHIPIVRMRKDQQKKGNLLGKLLGKEKSSENDNSLQGILLSSNPIEPNLDDNSRNAYVLYTSGTTSAPKGVLITQKNLLSHLSTLATYFEYEPTDKVLNILPYHHVDGFVQGPILCAYNGSNLIRPFTFSISKFEELFTIIRLNKISHFIAVPTLLSLLYPFYEDESSVFNYSEFKFIVSAAGKLESNLWSNFQTKYSVRIANLFGLTESVTGSLYCGPKPENYRLGSIGRPQDCETKIIDETGNEITTVGTIGELCLKGDHVMAGYISNESATREILINGWLHSGDLVRKDDEGFFWITGRKKSVIIRGGINIYPEEISEILNSFDEIKESVSLGLEDEMWGEQVISCVVFQNSTALTTEKIFEKLRSHLPAEKIPNKIIELDELPKGPSGKIQLNKVKELLEEKEKNKSVASSTGNHTEKLIQIAAEVFKVPANKLTLASSPENTPGWDSLGHMALVSSIEKSFGIKLSMKEVMKIECLGNAATIISGKVK